MLSKDYLTLTTSSVTKIGLT